MKIKLKYTLLILFTSVGLWQACSEEDATVGTPSVKSFTPSSGGPVGTVVGISSTYNSTVSAVPTVVKFNGVEAELVDKTPGALLAIVPAGATTGKISVSVNGISGSSATDFTVSSGTPAPYVLSFSPLKGGGLDDVSVDIKGVNFSSTLAENIVKFNGVAANVTAVSADKRTLTVKVPSGATSGKITVEVAGQTATSASDFSVPAPTITSVTPGASIVGGTVVISGTNFSATAANNIVKFNGVAADVPTSASATSLTVIVPAGATTGKISVTVDGQTATFGTDFTVN